MDKDLLMRVKRLRRYPTGLEMCAYLRFIEGQLENGLPVSEWLLDQVEIEDAAQSARKRYREMYA